MIVVSNTSPIINLAAIKQLHLLHQLYGKIIIPEAVYHEIAVIGDGQPGAEEVKTLEWIEKRGVINLALANALRMDLDEGEAEAIALAVEMKADLVLLDERRGRKLASNLGLKFIGLLGVIVEAKHKGLIDSVKPLLDGLVATAGFRITEELYNRVLEFVGE